MVFTFYFFDLYNGRDTSFIDLLFSVIMAVTLGLVIVMATTWFVRIFSFPRGALVYSWLLNIIFLTGWRAVIYKIPRWRGLTTKVLIVGTGDRGQEIASEIQRRPRLGYQIAGFIDEDLRRPGEIINDLRVLGNRDDISDIVVEENVEEIIIAVPPEKHSAILDTIFQGEKMHVRVKITPDLYDIVTGKAKIGQIEGIPLIELKDTPYQRWYRFVKRIMDIIISLIGLVIFSPFMLIIALLIRLDSPGAPIFRQERVGRGGRSFTIYKFRSMIDCAKDETGPTMTEENDPRITLLGRILRRTSLDELLNLYNVLRGEMSIVGPRPERPIFSDQFSKEIKDWYKRLEVKPGITGLAQINGRYNLSPKDKAEYDLYYVKNQSLLLDLKVMVNTIKVVLTGEGVR